MQGKNTPDKKWAPRKTAKQLVIYGFFNLVLCYTHFFAPGDIENTKAFPAFIWLIVFGLLILGVEIYVRAVREKV